MPRRRYAFILISLSALGSVFSAAADSRAVTELSLSPRQQTQLGVRTAAVAPARSLNLLASATVSLPPGREWLVTAPYAGVITRIHAGLGDTVSAGTAMVSISSPQLADARRMAREAQLEAQNTSAVLQRDQAMYDEGLIPLARLQLTQNRQRASEAAWQAQAASLSATGVGLQPGAEGYATAALATPRKGAVLELQARVGQHVESGEVLARLGQVQTLQLDLALSGDKAATLRKGDVVLVPSREARAEITGVSLALDASGQAQARAKVITRGRLQVGEVLPVQVQSTESLSAAQGKRWSVPARAVINYREQPWVFVASSQGFLLTPVTVHASNDESTVVDGPLKADSRVANAGLSALRALLSEGE